MPDTITKRIEELQYEIMEDYLMCARMTDYAKNKAQHMEEMRKHWEKLKAFVLSLRTETVEECLTEIEKEWKKVPASVQCRVAINCEYCAGRTDVSYHDCLSDLKQSLLKLKE